VPSSSAPPVLILTGAPGVGKTTVAASLASRYPRAVHLESDVFFRFVHSGYIEPWKPESNNQNRVVMQIVAAAAAGYAAAGYFTVIDGIVIPGWFLEPVREALHDAGHATALAILRAPAEVCAARVRAREGDAGFDAAAIDQLWRSFADVGALEANVLDVDGGSVEWAAETLAQRLADGLLLI